MAGWKCGLPFGETPGSPIKNTILSVPGTVPNDPFDCDRQVTVEVCVGIAHISTCDVVTPVQGDV